MKMSRRARRMERHHKRKKSFTGFNMVSLMDIFTILVFFLLVNSSDVQSLPSTKSVKLPDSIAEKIPKETLVVVVSGKDIIIQGRRVASVSSVRKSNALIIRPLQQALSVYAQREMAKRKSKKPFNGEITIMGDKKIPFLLLKKIMVTCAQSRYGRISLAVMQKAAS
jgi:biopolymer transport protein ExbD